MSIKTQTKDEEMVVSITYDYQSGIKEGKPWFLLDIMGVDEEGRVFKNEKPIWPERTKSYRKAV